MSRVAPGKVMTIIYRHPYTVITHRGRYPFIIHIFKYKVTTRKYTSPLKYIPRVRRFSTIMQPTQQAASAFSGPLIRLLRSFRMWHCPANSDNFLTAIRNTHSQERLLRLNLLCLSNQVSSVNADRWVSPQPFTTHSYYSLPPCHLHVNMCFLTFDSLTDKPKFISFALWDHYPTINHQAVLSKFLLSFGLDWNLALSWWCHLLSGPSHIPSIPASIFPPKILLFCFIKD